MPYKTEIVIFKIDSAALKIFFFISPAYFITKYSKFERLFASINSEVLFSHSFWGLLLFFLFLFLFEILVLTFLSS